MLAFLFLLGTAQAGELEVTVTIDEASRTFNFEQLASCTSTSVQINEDDFWYLNALATGVDDGIYVSLDIEAGLQRDTKQRREVNSKPSFIVEPGQPAKLQVSGDGGGLVVEVVANDFDKNDRCYPEGRRTRSTRSSSSTD